ncbi:MAG: DUF3667 domain-containing protein [Chitinophagaceae bacterium]
MSHIPQRKEKDCLNCGTIVEGRYCQHCGQENVVPKETFWHMVTHFFYDITHFDSNFFHTIHHLILKPGFLSKEYTAGRRTSYLHPVRMYVFTSAIFFLLFFSVFSVRNGGELDPEKPWDVQKRAEYLITLQNKLKNDSALNKDSANQLLLEKIAQLKDTSRPFTFHDMQEAEGGKKGLSINFSNRDYRSFAEYDSVEKTLSPGQRDGWLLRQFVRVGINLNNKYRDNPQEATRKIAEGFVHRLPYLLFISLPLFAFILRLVYIRRKQFYFADHGVFTIHLYVFSFIVLMLVFGSDKLQDYTHWGFLDTLQGFLFLGLGVYLYIGMRNFYRQGWFKTFLKFLLVTILSLIMMLILFTIFLLFSAATV